MFASYRRGYEPRQVCEGRPAAGQERPPAAGRRSGLLVVIGGIVAAGGLLPAAYAQTAAEPITENPLPEAITKQGLEVEIRDLARLPKSLGLLPPADDTNPAGWARVSFVQDLPDGRRFSNDQRGFIWIVEDGAARALYLDSREAFPYALYNRLESGLIGFEFHPEFASNGLLYTVHVEHVDGNPHEPDFIPPGFGPDDVTHHNVITEWQTEDPAADSFDGTRRELLRVAHTVMNASHPFGWVGFNPTAVPGDEDYGLLFTSGSDLGFSNGGGPNANNAGQTQRLDTVVTAILRIDPRSPAESGGEAGLGDYTIPPSNPYAGDDDPATLGEIYAHGFRNAHRLSWDLDDGTMFVGDIGMNHIEEINIVRKGENYGWMAREGHFENGMWREGGALNQLYTLPDDVLDGSTADEYTYPVAIYDHDEGNVVTGGFTYHGSIAALQGKFLFGDVRLGRLFAADLDAIHAADDGVPSTVAPIEEVQLYIRDRDGNREDVDFMGLVERTLGTVPGRADLHLSRGADGEILLTSRQDGMIRVLTD